MSEAMTINDIINQLGSLRASSAEFAKSDPENEIWQADVAACETAIRILAALSGAGCTDLETTLDFLQDYNSLAKQYQTLHLVPAVVSGDVPPVLHPALHRQPILLPQRWQ